jgi:hypothetical protein
VAVAISGYAPLINPESHARLRRLDGYNDLPHSVITLHELVSLHNLFELEDLANGDLELPTHQSRESMFHELVPQLPLVRLIATPQRAPDDPEPLHQDGSHIHILDLGPAHQAEHDDGAIAGRGVQVALEVRAADEVDDDVGAGAAGGLAHRGRPVGDGGRVERGRGAELALRERALVGPAGGREDAARPVGHGQLDARDRDGRRARVPQDRLARREAADQVHGLDGGDPRLRAPGGRSCQPG